MKIANIVLPPGRRTASPSSRRPCFPEAPLTKKLLGAEIYDPLPLRSGDAGPIAIIGPEVCTAILERTRKEAMFGGKRLTRG